MKTYRMVRDVLVAVDGSEYTERAVKLAAELFPDARLHLLHVLSPTEAGHTGEMALPGPADTGWYEQRQEQAEALLADLAGDIEGQEVTEAVRLGQPRREILQYVEEHDIDHIVMGSKGRQGFSRLLMGSVAEAVARRSTVPVTIAR